MRRWLGRPPLPSSFILRGPVVACTSDEEIESINRGADDDEPGRAWPMATRESRRSSWRALLLVPLLVAAIVLGAPAAADDDDAEEFTTAQFLAPTDGSLVTFDPSTLFGALVNHTVVVAFTVEWCALCTGYVPEFARVAAAFADATDGRRPHCRAMTTMMNPTSRGNIATTTTTTTTTIPPSRSRILLP